ncbi:MAG: NAD(P)-dependent oxidoreductase [Gemmatimonadota bacterium]|nr:NAD(P)-dependent oxidoreductase [Gemmatimonadota bacterium]
MLLDALRAAWPWSNAKPDTLRAVVRPERVLFTGAAGYLARALLPMIRPYADNWRLVDGKPEMSLEFSDRYVCKLGDGCDAVALLQGVDAVVHFAAQPKPAAPAVLRSYNVETVKWLLQNMAANGVKRLVYASSMHVMGMYRRTVRVTPSDPPLPDSPYGESKHRAELLIHAASATHDMQALVLRIGHAEFDARHAEPANWLAMQDLARLIEVGLTRDAPGVTKVHAVTPHRGDDLGQRAFAARFGITWSIAPTRAAANKRLASWYGNDPVAIALRGGVFASGQANTELRLLPLNSLDG